MDFLLFSIFKIKNIALSKKGDDSGIFKIK